MADGQTRGKLSRRQFLVGGALAAAGLGAARYLARRRRSLRVREHAPNDLSPGIAIVHGNAADPADEPRVAAAMTRRALDLLGGMGRLVKRGDAVVIKPNIAWVSRPEMAANTNPYVVAALVAMCREAGAGRVLVMDNTISADPASSYQASGIAAAAQAAGAETPFVDRSQAVVLPVPDGYELASWPFCREFVDARLCDVLINMPVLKHHGTSRLSIGLKNALGMVAGDRGDLHPLIHRKIPDLHRVIRVDLTVMDAYRVLRTHGPTGGSLQDVDNSAEGARRIVASRDPVAVDSYGARMFRYSADDIGFVRHAAEAGLGTADWRAMSVFEERM